ncbi:hypothetical protein Ais01nite_63520 [Asanoa ishikariensis]|uniref:PQQ-like domain-containing protein n=1 Tax=Asanoa ishikariensis TaxID=137265 RepID=A0A1H3NW71_9ACTN|nr:hypothetical protein [Asanoa ishikariensis]GIF68317.1 hypothetical protein Ais01nite_63520 [Asanoa ishikariensis]SDY92960.1 hypothetical protein SAMN05421684_2372 [Asanoa ishikariensis]
MTDEALWVVDESNVLLAWDGRTGQASARVELGGTGDVRWYPQAGGGLVWVFGSDGSVALVDPFTARLLAPPVIAPRPPGGLVGMPHYSHGAMWIWGTDRVWRVTAAGESSATPAERDTRRFGGAVQAAATDRWVFFGQGRQLLRVDPRTGAVADESDRLHAALDSARIPPPGVLDSMTAGPDDLVLAMGYNEPDIVVLDPDTMRPKWTTRVPDGSFVVTVHQSGRDIWALSESTAMRLDPGGGSASPLVRRRQLEAASAAVALGSLWIVDRDDEALVRLDVRTGRILGRLEIPGASWDQPHVRIVAGEHTVWLICRTSVIEDGVYRIDPDTNQVHRLAQPHELKHSYAAVAPAPRPQ